MQSLEELVKDFFEILDQTEESDNGRIFHPVQISSVRVLETEKMREVLSKMKEFILVSN
jgi:hypothetical protein